MKKLFGLMLIGAAIVGCSSSEVPITNAPPTNATSTPPGTAVQNPQNQTEAIRSNPNLPPAAKDALLGKGQ